MRKLFPAIFVLFGFYLTKSQNLFYAPPLSEIFMQKNDINSVAYKNDFFVKEMKRLTQNIYYGRYFFSLNNSGSERFVSISLVPKEKIIENIFNTKIDLDLSKKENATYILTSYWMLDNKDYKKKGERIYNQYNARIMLDSENPIQINFPLYIINPKIKNKEIAASFISDHIETEIFEGENPKIILSGKFSKPFYLKEGINSLLYDKFIFEIGEKNTLIKILSDEEEITLNTFKN